MPVGAVAAAASGSAGLLSMVLGLYPPILDLYTQSAYHWKPVKLPDLGSTVEMLHRKEISDGTLKGVFNRQGISSDWADKIINMSMALLAVGDLITLWRRGELPESELDTELEKLHYKGDNIERIKKVTEFFPAPADLVQFAVREVYTPAVVSQFGQMEDIPTKFIEEAAKAGLPKDQAENYWAAHWALPSAGQGFEMFQRDIIDEDILKMLLKSLDVMPYWRDQLIKLSYTPLTRVDVRRMHDMGILSDKQVEDAYRYRGYSPEDAKHMLDFTKLYNSQETTGLTRASVIKAYKRKLLNRSELSGVLEAFGYAPEVIDFWIDMADLEIELEAIEAREKDLLDRYRAGQIGLSQVKSELDAADLPSEYVDDVITKETLKKSAKLKLPTKTDLTNWLGLQIIDEVFYSEYMQMLGYEESDIALYLTEFSLTQDTSKRKFLPIKTYVRWMKNKIITADTFIDTATQMNISSEDIDRFILEIGE